MKRADQLFDALGGVGLDLVDMSANLTFARSLWRRALPVAACLALLLGGGALLLRQAAPSWPGETQTPVQAEGPPEPEAPEETEVPAESEPVPEESALPVWQPEEMPFYVLERESGAVAVDADGNVLVDTRSGTIAPLIDRETGDCIAITVCHRSAETALEDVYYDIYNLQGGKVIDHLMAYGLDCLGNVVVVNSYMDGAYQAALYQRDTYACLRSDLWNASVQGDCIQATPVEHDGMSQWLFDRDGQLTVLDTVQAVGYFSWNGKTYFIATEDGAHYGLLDSKGNQLLPFRYTNILGISNGYIRCQDDGGHYAVDLATGETAFRWDWPVLEVYEQVLMVHDEDYNWLLVDWQGNILQTGSQLRAVDDEGDGVPELFLLQDAGGWHVVEPDGALRLTLGFSGELEAVSARTAVVCQPEDGTAALSLLDLQTGAAISLTAKRYDQASVIQENGAATGLFYGAYPVGGGCRWDVLREDGTVVLEGLPEPWVHQPGGVFTCEKDGQRGLLRLDGSWLYREALDDGMAAAP